MKPTSTFTYIPTFRTKKLGGENAAKLKASVMNVLGDAEKGNKQAIVTSAMRSEDFNTTDKLVFIGEMLSNPQASFNNIEVTLKELEDFHIEIVENELGRKSSKIIPYIKEEFDGFSTIIRNWMGRNRETEVPSKDNDFCIEGVDGRRISIIGFGEVLAAGIIAKTIGVLGGKNTSGKLLDLSHSINPRMAQDIKKREDYLNIASNISGRVTNIVESGEIPVLTGYFGELQAGVINSVGRGYTDATAGMLSVGLSRTGERVLLEIQKSVKGILSADPRELDNPDDAKLIPYVDYVTANEITGERGAQAKLLHKQVLRQELQEAGVVIRLYDPFSDDENTGTIIQKKSLSETEGVEFVGGRRGTITFSISSAYKINTELMLRTLDIVKNYGEVITSSTSSTEFSFTLDGNEIDSRDRDYLLKDLEQEFDLHGSKADGNMEFVECKSGNAMLFCIGQNMKDKSGVMKIAVDALAAAKVNINTESQPQLQRAISIGVEERDLKTAIGAVHAAFKKEAA